MDAVQLPNARFVAARQAGAWTSLLLAAQAMDVVTTAVDSSRGTVESMAVSAQLLDHGGLRTASDADDMVGVDAALDYPLYFVLPPIVKGFASPSRLYSMFEQRRRIEGEVTSSHGDATRYFVT